LLLDSGLLFLLGLDHVPLKGVSGGKTMPIMANHTVGTDPLPPITSLFNGIQEKPAHDFSWFLILILPLL